MAKKKKGESPEETTTNYYDLKVDSIDELVAALKGEDLGDTPAPTTDIEEITGEKVHSKKQTDRHFDPYKRDALSKLPTWLKAVFIKWWFAGLVCWLIMSGLGTYITSGLDMLVVVGFAMGIVVDVFVNPLLKMMDSDRNEYDNYIMFPFPFKKFWTFFANMGYYLVVIIGVNYVYAIIRLVWADCPIEALFFGVFTVAVDMAFIGIKDAIVCAVKNRKEQQNVPIDEDCPSNIPEESPPAAISVDELARRVQEEHDNAQEGNGKKKR